MDEVSKFSYTGIGITKEVTKAGIGQDKKNVIKDMVCKTEYIEYTITKKRKSMTIERY